MDFGFNQAVDFGFNLTGSKIASLPPE